MQIEYWLQKTTKIWNRFPKTKQGGAMQTKSGDKNVVCLLESDICVLQLCKNCNTVLELQHFDTNLYTIQFIFQAAKIIMSFITT